jgi:hypothetical protein
MTSRTFVVGINTIVFLLFLIFVLVAICALHLNAIRNEICCYHPLTDAARIFVGECVYVEDYGFSQCYNKWVDSQEHGSVMLEMPTNWV